MRMRSCFLGPQADRGMGYKFCPNRQRNRGAVRNREIWRQGVLQLRQMGVLTGSPGFREDTVLTMALAKGSKELILTDVLFLCFQKSQERQNSYVSVPFASQLS